MRKKRIYNKDKLKRWAFTFWCKGCGKAACQANAVPVSVRCECGADCTGSLSEPAVKEPKHWSHVSATVNSTNPKIKIRK